MSDLKQKVSFDWTFRMGDVLVLMGLIIGFVGGGYVLSYRVGEIEKRQTAQEAAISTMDKENTKQHQEISLTLERTATIVRIISENTKTKQP